MDPKVKKYLWALFFFLLPLALDWVAQHMQAVSGNTILVMMVVSLAAYLKKHPITYEDEDKVDPNSPSVSGK